MMRRGLLAVVLGCVATTALARTVVERDVRCLGTVEITIDDGGVPRAFITCGTYDATGALVRAPRAYDIYPRLTAAQQAGIVAILGRIQALAYDEAAVPSPTPTPTTTARTPTPTPTVTAIP